jgi:hypothetical protein
MRAPRTCALDFPAATLQVPFGELKKRLTHLPPALQARLKANYGPRNAHHSILAECDVGRSRSVTAPKEALLTSREYFAKAPRRA